MPEIRVVVQYGLKPVLLIILMIAVFFQITLFSPTPLERRTRQPNKNPLVDPRILVKDSQTGANLAPGIPEDKIPDYSVDDFVFYSSKGEKKDYKIVAEIANHYETLELMHGKSVTAYLFDENEQQTIVRGQEAKFFTVNRKIEMFGDVETTFPDGFTIYSEYMRYEPDIGEVIVPPSYFVRGEGSDETEEKLQFTSFGINYKMEPNLIYLNRDVHFKLTKQESAKPKDPDLTSDPGEDYANYNDNSEQVLTSDDDGEGEFTKIDSDSAVIDRSTQIAHFHMDPQRDLKDRFVHFHRNSLFMISRDLDLHYGSTDASTGSRFNRLVAMQDVFIRELGEEEVIRYGTCGQADYDAIKNIIVLTKFPQVYQDNDTVTGDVITIYRDTDVVEVEKSNAFSSTNNSQ